MALNRVGEDLQFEVARFDPLFHSLSQSRFHRADAGALHPKDGCESTLTSEQLV